ncbi:MAG TPA: hypothetical protein VMI75_01650 [Polyangiaceae bacterium]|nr:hypothetical protein [Polyangiaceae bacterium]
MTRSLPFVALVLALASAALAPACGSSNQNGGFTPDASSSGGDGSAGDDGSSDGPSFGGDSSHGAVVALSVTPKTSTITVTNPASPPTTTLTAVATYADGTNANVPASWTVDRFDIAGVGAASGKVTPTGTTFGIVTATASAAGKTATGAVTVDLKTAINPGNVPPAGQTSLNGATASDPGVTTFAYPYDGTVFPEGLLPPEQQWNGGAAGDQYSLHYTGPHFDLTVYFEADPPSRMTLPVTMWNSLTSSLASLPITVELHRLSGGTAYKSASQAWHVANANLRGDIYYWAINQGQIYKIDLASGMRSPVFDSGPSTSLGTPTPLNSGSPNSPPWEDNGAGKRCVACHSVSKDGSTLVSVFSRYSPGSTGPVGFVSLATGAIADISDYTTDGIYDALSPDGAFSVVNYSDKSMGLVVSSTAMPAASALDGQTNLCDPVFSPDGTLFALAANCDPGFGYPVEFRTSNLVVYSFSKTAPYFTNPQTVVTSSGQGDAIAFPSFSPDSKFVFFQRGDYSRAKYGTNQHGNDDLYVVPAQAGAAPVALASANNPGNVLPADSQHLNYAPTVNPIASGGYVWVVFTSPRDYGNEMVSPEGAPPNDATYQNHKQLWVAAVDANIGTVDPSHPPFWLPGQDSTTANMFGYWALSPCKPTMGDGGPQTCAAGFECCSGFCRDTDGGPPVCVDNPGGCHQVGEKCTTTADCCNSSGTVQCIGGVCQETMPQ